MKIINKKMDKYIVIDCETTGLNAWQGDELTCICAKDNEGNWFVASRRDCSEYELMFKFLQWLNEKEGFSFVTKNGKGFDVPFILTRAIDYPDIFPDLRKILLKTNHLDLQLLTKKWISLNDMAMLLGCPLKVGTGFDAIKFFKEEKFDELEGYCRSDVIITKQVYNKLKQLEVIKDGQQEKI